MDVAVPLRPRVSVLEQVAATPAGLVLALLVTLSTAVRTVAALAHTTQVYFPDEYIYTSLARGLAETGRPVIRGHAAHFPSILEPLLAAPFWLFHDPLLAYRLTQAENALFMSLGLVPVYLIARRLGLGKWTGLALCAVVAAAPGMFFSAFVFSGPVAFPFVLGAVYAAVCVLDRPTRGAQLAFVGLSALATLARIQYCVLPVALVAAGLVVERGNVRRLAGNLRLSLLVFGGGLAVVLAAGPARALGYYSGVAQERIRPGALLHWLAVDALFFVYSVGVVIVPGALVGLWVALRRPHSRSEQAFAAFTAALLGLLFLQAALYASNGSERFQERYLIAKLPLVVLAFACYARRGLPGRRFVAGLSALVVVLAASMPLSGYAFGLGKQDSPMLRAVYRLENAFGTASGALAAALCITALCGVAVGLTVDRRRALWSGLAVTAAVCGAIGAAAYSVDRENTSSVRAIALPADRSWIDDAHLGHVSLVETPGGPSGRAFEQLSWNRSVDSVYLLGGVPPLDKFGSEPAHIGLEGGLVTSHGALAGPLLVENYAVQLRLRRAALVQSAVGFDLWRPLGRPRADWATFGRFYDGWLAGSGTIVVWPDASGRTEGTLRLVLESPANAEPLRMEFGGRTFRRTVDLRPGERRVVSVRIAVRGAWEAAFASSMHAVLDDGRSVSVRVGGPTFERSGAAAPGSLST